jgi:hypothetical protein
MFTKATIVIKSNNSNLPSNEETSRTRTSGSVSVNLKGKKRVASEAMAAPAKKKKKSKPRKIILSSDDDDDDTSKAGPSNIGGLAHPRVPSEPSEDSEAGKVT